MTAQDTMPDPEGRELTIHDHVVQSTQIHPDWHELDHVAYLISEVGFDAGTVQTQMTDIIHTMIETRAPLQGS